MSEGENHHHGKNEIIIVKRHKGDHDGAHGGAWKIAYADFMTAMMAFFLVMWLVNASNEETKASVASYFNPIKLTDEKPADKGMKQPAKTAKGEQTQQTSDTKSEKPQDAAAAASGEDMTSSAGDKTAYSEAAFFENPYAVLAEIAQEVGQQANVSAKGEGGASQSGPSTGASGGEAYRDPFDPDFWSKQVDVPPQPATVVTQDTALPQKEQKAADAKAAAAKQDIADVISDSEPVTPAPTAAPKNAKTELASVQKNQMPDEAADVTDAEKKTTDELRDEIAQQVAGVAGKLAEGIVVTPAEGGTLITISEKANTSMFDVGSAVPQKTLVLAMEKIGEVLSKQKGAVVIRGHTDARPYSTGGKDNWTLSMDRAHAAFYMLSRGGLDETRIKQLSGFADRRLQNTDDPLNGANRRIEILLEDS
ncbi:chemotaxis motility protein MotB [Agrobacterium rubi TR3 = NBRC 13261]|uniref:Chemotaxis motility protein MotB n=1 Tax=Agrobacterium rubi TR3 = NBRC 13261 TaxID=1368415 RepID=A0A081CU89_9HYPH|nr:MotB family protein [Agrobacterium rubi]MBP1879087.1 chemotaxis protein MotB [Agrobacterium rubi]MCL6652407.1 flagellar motor protein MotB [Agrobacterium rubi]GAK70235.1 chemotaxis motility protein MotB [Agrobacterium rubi TR3 = NBRC 13261]